MTIASPISKVTADKPRRKIQTNAAGRELMAGLRQAYDAAMSGDPLRGMTVREVEIPDPPAYTGADVKESRRKLGVSTALFARLMGVSGKLVEHWEQGRRARRHWPAACWKE